MTRATAIAAAAAAILFLSTGVALAADPAPTQERAQAGKRERVYGSRLMTAQERNEHRTRMRAAKTAQEREQLRKEHHQAMKERAKARGVMLPDEPPARGSVKGRSAEAGG